MSRFKLDDYQAHLCSEAGQKELEKNTDQIVLRTDIPNETKQE